MVRRVYAEKKKEYAVLAKELKKEIKGYLSVKNVKDVRILIRYDIEDISDEVYKKAINTVFSEPPVDNVYENDFNRTGHVFSVEYLPGQFDQRADSAVQCIKLIKEDEDPKIKTATTYVIEGDITKDELLLIKNHTINPVDSREASEEIFDTLTNEYPEPEDIKVLDGFIELSDDELKEMYDSFNLAMTFKDFLHIRNYFKNDEMRSPTMTEIRVLDTYWSDHCRHTTFSTELKGIKFNDGYFAPAIKQAYLDYLSDFTRIYEGRKDKYVCLMDIATLSAKVLKADGKLTDQEESEEINACSIVSTIEVDGKEEEWIINFKNETHNHPTEIEPFGGAATCLGGAIRDPLSGRTYVYQAMRVTGASDPRASVSDTLKGKLPQKKIVREAAKGYSSYGNQIGLSTGYVKEIYHPDYVAKRMEIGAVMGAAKRSAIKREKSEPGDIIILLGGRTGRDGIGGATGSSKAHNKMSTELCGAEVQKGNPPTERKLQRLFRREEVSSLIKKCNDFGAGGVSVAIGELADGLLVDLDKVPKKYAGLDGTELSISESQERIAVVVRKEDAKKFIEYASEENLEATEVACVTEEKRLILKWRGKEIVNLKREFLDTNGAHQECSVLVEMPDEDKNFFKKYAIDKVSFDIKGEALTAAFIDTVSDLNVCSQEGLVEMFDGSIGAGSVLMPYGGRYQKTETQAMVGKIPVPSGETDDVSIMAYGFDPYLSSWSPFHGAQFSIIESVSRIVSSGGDWKKIHFTFQEYFKRMTEDEKRWGAPFSALIGAHDACMRLGLASIGGKDSMSGTFDDIDVPPTLVSFAVCMGKGNNIITPELKEKGNCLYLLKLSRDEYECPNFEQNMTIFELVTMMIKNKDIISSYSIDAYGAAAAIQKMCFGNNLGVDISGNISYDELFKPHVGSFLVEVKKEKEAEFNGIIKDNNMEYFVKDFGEVTDNGRISYRDMIADLSDLRAAYEKPLEEVFCTKSGDEKKELKDPLYVEKNIYIRRSESARPKVFIPVFPGTNCEYDSERAFKEAGADTVVKVFRNQSEDDIRSSVREFKDAIDSANIIMFPGGFSAGDEPEGSAKFFASAFRNPVISESVSRLLNERDGLMLGICNGFQALIKLGLLPYGEIRPQDEDSPTLTYNTIGRHISKMVYTKVVSDKSPWLSLASLGETYVSPASHGEGRFVANDEWIDKLFKEGCVATRYSTPEGVITTDEEWNVNGSYQAIEGITSKDGRIFGKMAHVERRGNNIAKNIYGEQDLKIFKAGVNYFTA